MKYYEIGGSDVYIHSLPCFVDEVSNHSSILNWSLDIIYCIVWWRLQIFYMSCDHVSQHLFQFSAACLTCQPFHSRILLEGLCWIRLFQSIMRKLFEFIMISIFPHLKIGSLQNASSHDLSKKKKKRASSQEMKKLP